VWFGIIVVCVIEISLITPPVGMNIFVLSSVVPGIPTATIWRGVMPFVGADMLRMATLITFPAIALYLPRLLNL
jgi:C4-dicarboxylate transporter DctM subunit